MLPEGRLSGSLKATGCPGLKARFFWRGRVHGLKPPFDSVAYATSLRAGCGFYRRVAGAAPQAWFVSCHWWGVIPAIHNTGNTEVWFGLRVSTWVLRSFDSPSDARRSLRTPSILF